MEKEHCQHDKDPQPIDIVSSFIHYINRQDVCICRQPIPGSTLNFIIKKLNNSSRSYNEKDCTNYTGDSKKSTDK